MHFSLILSLFFFSSRRRHTRLQGDWSSDVCSSDLIDDQAHQNIRPGRGGLFTLRQNVLRLRREREKLKSEVASLFQQIDAATANFQESTHLRMGALTRQMEQNLAEG